MSQAFECVVGGVVFNTTVESLSIIQDSFFTIALSDTWKAFGATSIKIDRDGTLFQYILDYLRYGYLPRDSTGRCNIPRDILEALLVEADFYGLPLLVKEIEPLLKFNMKGMRYFISYFFLNSSSGGGLSLKEFSSHEAACKQYEKCKSSFISSEDVAYGQNIVVIEKTDPVTGKINNEVFKDGNWKRPEGNQLLCIPLTEEDTDGVIFKTGVRTYPDENLS